MASKKILDHKQRTFKIWARSALRIWQFPVVAEHRLHLGVGAIRGRPKPSVDDQAIRRRPRPSVDDQVPTRVGIATYLTSTLDVSNMICVLFTSIVLLAKSCLKRTLPPARLHCASGRVSAVVNVLVSACTCPAARHKHNLADDTIGNSEVQDFGLCCDHLVEGQKIIHVKHLHNTEAPLISSTSGP